MTFIPHDIEPRTLYISKAGNDQAGGDECPICLNTFEELTSRIAALDPPPSQSEQAAAISLARGRYDPIATVQFPAWCQVDMPTVTIANGNIASGPTYKAASTSGVVVQGVTAIGAGQSAYSFDGTSRSGIEADAITSIGGANALEIINGAAGSFCEIGQTIADGTNVFIQTLGDRPSIANVNVVDMIANGARGFYVEVADGIPCFMKGNGVRFAASPFGGSVPTTGTALQIETGDTITYDYQYTQGDMLLNDAKATLHVQHYENGSIFVVDGEYFLDMQIIEGDLSNNNGRIVLEGQEQIGDITQIGASSQLSVSTQVHTGDITTSDGLSSVAPQAMFGDYKSNGGLNFLSSQVVTGNVEVNGGSCDFDIGSVIGDFTVAAGATATGTINSVSGTITIIGTFNGEIAGVRYGSWIEGSDVLATYTRTANVPNNWDNMGYGQIDTNTDTMDYITVQYRQNSNGSRTHKVRIIDADDEFTVYFEGDSGSLSGSGNKGYDVSITPVNPLPTGTVNLAFEHERDGGAGIADTTISFGFTRV